MYYTPQELYAGNKDGYPLDPALYDISMKFHFGGGNQAPATPAPPQQTNATIASVGDSIRRPSKRRKKTNLASLRIAPKAVINKLVGGNIGGGGTGLNIGSFG